MTHATNKVNSHGLSWEDDGITLLPIDWFELAIALRYGLLDRKATERSPGRYTHIMYNIDPKIAELMTTSDPLCEISKKWGLVYYCTDCPITWSTDSASSNNFCHPIETIIRTADLSESNDTIMSVIALITQHRNDLVTLS